MVKHQGGIGFIAHPHEDGSRYILGGRTYPWTDWTVKGYTGICIWNMLSQWRDKLNSPWHLFWYGFVRPGDALTGPRPETLAVWDEVNQNQKVTAVGGSDAHAIKLGIGPCKFTFGSYSYSFRCINTHILTEEALKGDQTHSKSDIRMIMNALRAGRCFIALDLLGRAKGFRFYARTSDKEWEMGSNVPWPQDGLALSIAIPDDCPSCRVNIIKNGRLVHCIQSSSAQEITIPTDSPGVYRAEVYRRKHRGAERAWIYSNPIRIL